MRYARRTPRGAAGASRSPSEQARGGETPSYVTVMFAEVAIIEAGRGASDLPERNAADDGVRRQARVATRPPSRTRTSRSARRPAPDQQTSGRADQAGQTDDRPHGGGDTPENRGACDKPRFGHGLTRNTGRGGALRASRPTIHRIISRDRVPPRGGCHLPAVAQHRTVRNGKSLEACGM